MKCAHCDRPVRCKGLCNTHYLKDYTEKNKDRLRELAKMRVKNDPEGVQRRQRAYVERHKDLVVARNAAKYQSQREERIAAAAEWRKSNPEAARINGAAQRARRRAAEKRATPVWACHQSIRRVYEQCSDVTKATGIAHEVDHIVPLAGKNVCGLHVHWNLRVIPASDNRSKGNRMEMAVP